MSLPEGWTQITIGQAAQVLRGVTYKRADALEESSIGYLPVVRATNIVEGRLVTDEGLVFVPEKLVKPEQRLRAGDLVLATSSGSLSAVGRSAPVTEDWDGGFGAFCGVLRPTRRVLPKYLHHYVSTQSVRRRWSNLAAGTNINNLKRSDLEGTPVPLPPLPEQRRIVEAIEEQFSRLDAAEKSVLRARRSLLGLRRVVVSLAAGGRLGALLWVSDASSDEAIPEEWRWSSVAELGMPGEQPVLTGPFGTTLSRRDFVAEGVPVLTIGCLTDHGVVLDRADHVTEQKAKQLSRYRVRGGDLLFSRMATVGRAGVVATAQEGALVNYHLMRLRLDVGRILPEFFLIYVRGSSRVQRHLREVNHGATRDGINTKELLTMPVAVPPIDHQRRVVEEVDRWLSGIDAMLALADTSLKRAAVLRRAVLREAFAGRLVPRHQGSAPSERVGA